MTVIWTKNGMFRLDKYKNEADLEKSVLEVRDEMFGRNRIYLDVKKKIGTKGGQRNIPDGYLIDLGSSKPRLYVVENELEEHDPTRHIAMQILEFSLAFESEPRTVKTILFDALAQQPEAKARCEKYALKHGFRNLDNLLDMLVYEAPFAALVIIDQIPDKLEKILAEKFKFGTEVLEIQRYLNSHGEYLYHFEPFLAGITEDVGTDTEGLRPLDISEVDTVVVPARAQGFQSVFLGKNCWYAIRIHGTMRPQIKYIAAYQVAPISAITHIAPVASIEPWSDSRKYIVNFAEPAQEIGAIRLLKGGRVKPLYNLRYTTLQRLEKAHTLDDVW